MSLLAAGVPGVVLADTEVMKRVRALGTVEKMCRPTK